MDINYEAANAMLNAFYNLLEDRMNEDPGTAPEPEAENTPQPIDDEVPDGPVMFEDEIAEVFAQHRGEEILVYFNPESPLKFRYSIYERDKYIVFAAYDALENHCLVTVNGTNILDL